MVRTNLPFICLFFSNHSSDRPSVLTMPRGGSAGGGSRTPTVEETTPPVDVKGFFESTTPPVRARPSASAWATRVMQRTNCIPLTPKWLQCVPRLSHLRLFDSPPLFPEVSSWIPEACSRPYCWGVRRNSLASSWDKLRLVLDQANLFKKL